MRNLPNLDVLRTVAVLSVVVCHTLLAMGFVSLHMLPVGWLGVFGVCLFFVHTTLVLMWSLERQPHVLNFYIRRAFRIYPLAAATLAIVLAFHIYVDYPPVHYQDVRWASKEIVENFLLMPSFGARTIYGYMWSLQFEVLMYLVLPALFLYIHRERRIWQVVVLWVLAVLVASEQSWGFAIVAPDFLPGALAYLAFDRTRARVPAWLFAPLLVLLIVVPAPVVEKFGGYQMSWILTLCLAFALPLFRQPVSRPWIAATHAIAKYSYGIYLGHPIGIAIGFYLLRGHRVAIQLAAELAFTAFFAVIGYHAIEEPLIRLGSRLAKANDRREAEKSTPAAALS